MRRLRGCRHRIQIGERKRLVGCVFHDDPGLPAQFVVDVQNTVVREEPIVLLEGVRVLRQQPAGRSLPLPFLADFQATISWEIPAIVLSRTES